MLAHRIKTHNKNVSQNISNRPYELEEYSIKYNLVRLQIVNIKGFHQ